MLRALSRLFLAGFLSLAVAVTPCYAVLNAFVGDVTTKTSTTTLAETGVGFQPEGLIFFGNPRTGDGTGTNADMMFAVCVSGTEEVVLATVDQDGGGGSDNANITDDDECVHIATRSDANIAVADMSSLDADGFTLSYTNADATGRIVSYLALDGLDNIDTGTITTPTSTGNQEYNVTAFTPDAVIFFMGECTSTQADVVSASIGAFIGVGTSSSERGYVSWGSGDAAASANTDSRASGTNVLGCENPGSAEDLEYQADIVSLDADGFTLDYDTVDASARTVLWVAIEGGNWGAGSFTQKTSTGSQTVSGLGFDPVGVLFLSDNEATFGHSVTYEISIGAATASDEERNIWWGALQASDPMEMDRLLDSNGVINMVDSGTPTTVATADYTSNDVGGFTVNWSVADATARNIIYLAFGNPTVAATRRVFTIY